MKDRTVIRMDILIFCFALQKTLFQATHHGKKGTERSKSVVAEKRHGGIKPGQSDSWSDDTLVVPPLPPSGLVGCNLIDIHYILKVSKLFL